MGTDAGMDGGMRADGGVDAGAPVSFSAMVVPIFGSWRQTRTGDVNWPDAIVIGLVSVVTAVAGALIADVAPERVLRIGFAILLVATAAQLVVRERRRTPEPGRDVKDV